MLQVHDSYCSLIFMASTKKTTFKKKTCLTHVSSSFVTKSFLYITYQQAQLAQLIPGFWESPPHIEVHVVMGEEHQEFLVASAEGLQFDENQLVFVGDLYKFGWLVGLC